MANYTFPQLETQTIAIKLTVAGERSIRKQHPWIFSESIEKINKEGQAGDITIIFSHNGNKPIGVGLFDPYSPIRIKMLHFGSGAKLDSAFFSKKIERAYSLRKDLQKTNTNSYRLLFGENDGFPGLIADVYANVLVVKIYSAIWWPYFETILKTLLEVSKCSCAILRLGRNLQKEPLGKMFEDGAVVFGTLENETIYFKEHGVQFSANVIKGHKTGYFLDHRHNRKSVGELSKGKSVLDVFAYAGGFSVHALVNGAKEVTSLDISEQALQLALDNGKRNAYTGSHKTLTGDAFMVMQQLIKSGKLYEVVVIDPPSFAKSAKEVTIALKKYAQLAALGVQLMAPKGLLVLASCSSRVNSEDFFATNEKALKDSGRKYKILDKTHHDIDHPIGFPEGAYLKCGYYQLDK
ncbi:MAG: class I SAM-dependent rRNA methyltransferase [Flavobacteriaceae bacterium]